LGSGEFVQQLIQQSDIERKRQFSMKENLEQAIWYIADSGENCHLFRE
jgi:hypothetical protein